jgi:hypothetical protein
VRVADANSTIQISESVIGWLLGAAGTLILFLLGLGVTDLRNKLKKVDTMCVSLARMEERVKALEDKE